MAIVKSIGYGFEKQITGSDMFYRLESKKRVGAIHNNRRTI